MVAKSLEACSKNGLGQARRPQPRNVETTCFRQRPRKHSTADTRTGRTHATGPAGAGNSPRRLPVNEARPAGDVPSPGVTDEAFRTIAYCLPIKNQNPQRGQVRKNAPARHQTSNDLNAPRKQPNQTPRPKTKKANEPATNRFFTPDSCSARRPRRPLFYILRADPNAAGQQPLPGPTATAPRLDSTRYSGYMVPRPIT